MTNKKLKKLLSEDEEIELGSISMIGDVANLKLPDPSLRDFYAEEKDRVIRIYSEIDDSTLEVLDKIIKYNKEDKGLPKEKRKPIRIIINTYGGDARVALTIMHAIIDSITPVWTINMCKAYSAGALILVCGHRRFATKGSCVVIHRGSVCMEGEASMVESAQRSGKKLTKQIEEILFNKTGISKDFYMKKASSDIYYEAEECLRYCVIDEIIEKFEDVL